MESICQGAGLRSVIVPARLFYFIDIKDDGLATYNLLEYILNGFREILCFVFPGRFRAGKGDGRGFREPSG